MHYQELLAESFQKSPWNKREEAVRKDVRNEDGVDHQGRNGPSARTVYEVHDDDAKEREAPEGYQEHIRVVSSPWIPTRQQFWVEGGTLVQPRVRLNEIGASTVLRLLWCL